MFNTTTKVLCKRQFSTFSYTLSKIGQRTLKYWPEVKIKVEPFQPTPSFPNSERQVIVQGPLGSLSLPIQPFVNLEFPTPPEDSPKKYMKVVVNDSTDKFQKSMWGTTWALINNMVEGVSAGFTVPIRLNGIGYRAALENSKLTLKLGYANTIELPIVEGVEVLVPTPQRILLKGIDLQKVSQYASKIRSYRPPEPYNLKGVFVGDETIKKKAGKSR